MPFLQALAGLGVLLVVGMGLRLAVPALGRLLLPVPLIGGFVGLAAGPYGLDVAPRETVAMWAALPPTLISLVFAALFLGVAVPSPRAIVRLAGPLVRFSMVGALGQYVVALLLTWLVLEPRLRHPRAVRVPARSGFLRRTRHRRRDDQRVQRPRLSRRGPPGPDPFGRAIRPTA